MLTVGKIEGLDQLNATLRQFSVELGNDAANEIRIGARNLAVQLARETFPTTPADRTKVENTITSDFAAVYASARKTHSMLFAVNPRLAKAFWAVYRKTDNMPPRTLASFVRGTPFDGTPIVARLDPALVDSARSGTRRRVSGGTYNPQRLLRRSGNSGPLMRAAKRRFRVIGVSAAAWAWVANDLGGTRGIPAWKSIGRHKTRTGRAIISRQRSLPSIILSNEISYIQNNLDPGLINRAVAETARRLQQRLKIAIRARERKV
jgi:hypothetical protein